MAGEDGRLEGEHLEGEAEQLGIRGPRFVSRWLLELDDQWPSFRFLGFGFYYAWIFLLYSSKVLVPDGSIGGLGVSCVFLVYLVSTTALALMLIACSFFDDAVRRLTSSLASMASVGVVAGIATVGVYASAAAGTTFSLPALVICAAITGVTTSALVLRMGILYSYLDAKKAISNTCISFMMASALYFVGVGVPQPVGLALTALLPLSAVFATAFGYDPDRETELRERALRRRKNPPVSFMVRSVVAIVAFAAVTGVSRGTGMLEQSSPVFEANSALVIFGTALLAGVLFLGSGLLSRRYDISRIYTPLVLITCLGILVSPFLGDGANAIITGISYNGFSLVIWCLLVYVSRGTASPVRIMGLGRGASALGSVAGWLVGFWAFSDAGAVTQAMGTMLPIATLLVLLVIQTFVFNDSVIDRGLRQLPIVDASDDLASHAAPSQALDAGATAVDFSRAWKERCMELGEEFGLTPREQDVLFLLSRGRSIEFVANELVISFNTAKAHARHIYVKMGVHTRQELIDLLERE